MKAESGWFRENEELTKLLALLNSPPSKQKIPSAQKDGTSKPSSGSLQWPVRQPKNGEQQQQTTEALALERFSLAYQMERNFSKQTQQKYFTEIFTALIKRRFSSSDWIQRAPPENILRVVMCLRILMRDVAYQKHFSDLDGVNILAGSLVLLLNASDIIVLHCSLHALISLAHSAEPRSHIVQLNAIEMLLQILQDYDTLSKKLVATLLRLLCADAQAREMVKAYDGIALLLSLLHNDNVKLLWNIVWCLVQLSSDQEASNDTRQMGGIPLLLSLLHERSFVSDRSSTSDLSSSDPMTPLEEAEELKEHQFSLKSACCACLTELVLNDTNAQQVAQANGIYLLALLILPSFDSRELTDRQTKALHTLQANVFRTLRFLFSMERNRKLFKRLFPPHLFEMFIDIGHYQKDIAAYHPLVDKLHTLSADTLDEINESIQAIDQNKPPSHYIGDYAVLDLLGSGAFGSVYRVKKKTSGQSYLAMKEINTMNPTWGKTSKERQKSVGVVISELTIIREQLRHPNVVHYYKTFVEQEKLYIVMELIEGVPLGEHFTFLKEKGEKFSEDRIWNVFIQETEWKGDRARTMVGGYKLLHAGGDGRSNGVGIIVSEEISKTVVRVDRWKGHIVMAWLIIRKQLMCVMSVYGPQTGRTEAEKEEFGDALERMIGLVELEVMLCIAGDFNAHVGVVEPGEEQSVGRCGWGARNREGRALVELVVRNGLAVASSFFQKRESHKITYRSGQHKT
ncbi:Serine/threonine-protein kinase Nek10 [Lamellibrachia satsuma]|nr:Serine/threonine-protein kinase Nek10 [Lamellibrachia satsuma]